MKKGDADDLSPLFETIQFPTPRRKIVSGRNRPSSNDKREEGKRDHRFDAPVCLKFVVDEVLKRSACENGWDIGTPSLLYAI